MAGKGNEDIKASQVNSDLWKIILERSRSFLQKNKGHTVIVSIRESISDRIKHFFTWRELCYTQVYLSRSLRVWLVSTTAKDQPFCQCRKSHVSCFHPCHGAKSFLCSRSGYWRGEEKNEHCGDFNSCKVFHCIAQSISVPCQRRRKRSSAVSV